jgi:eukaryotic-like serine/threonine-protein kinase
MNPPRIVLLDVVGKGGMSRVYRAESPENGEVAVKCLGPLLESSSRHERELLLEGEYTRAFEHPRVVRTLAAGAATLVQRDGSEALRSCLAMPFVTGLNLRQLMTRHPAPQLWRRGAGAALAWQVLEALDYLARQGAAPHADLTPSNLLVSEDGGVRLCDFGLSALIAEGVARAPWLRSTTRYMSPRVAAGEAPSFATDVYSLGAILCELWAGAAKNYGARPPDHEALAHAAAPVPEALAGDSFGAFLARAVSPSHGFATAREALDALGAIAPRGAVRDASSDSLAKLVRAS